MNIARNLCIKYSLFIVFALLISGGMLVHGTASADETFAPTGVIKVPNAGFLPSAAPSATTCGPTATNPFCLTSFDIGFVDPQLGLYFLADRTNRTIDQVKTSDNSITQLAVGSFVGVQAGTTSGPNGVITANNHTEVWAGDGVPAGGTSRVVVINLKTGKVINIDTGGTGRADELCEDPQQHVVLVANDEPSDLFLTFISTDTYKVIKQIKLDGTDRDAQNVNATNGIEQCQWSPRTRKFYLAIPEVSGTGANTVPGAVLQINSASLKVEKVFPIDFNFSAGTPSLGYCMGPQGLAIGPSREILLGCSNAGAGSVVINELDGSLAVNLKNLNGNDEVWYNPGDDHYFLAGSNHNLSSPIAGPILGVADRKGDPDTEDAAPATKSGSHSVAADPVKNQVYVPVNSGSAPLCGETTTGCIAVFTTTNNDLGVCTGNATPANGEGKQGDPVFLRQVCPDNNGHP